MVIEATNALNLFDLERKKKVTKKERNIRDKHLLNTRASRCRTLVDMSRHTARIKIRQQQKYKA
ncbi:hypothetical protein BpHYR1_046245 [Brachionus plicatilis]|uniref:Uncharacterized protein n=1 Tax=Brachionus plicatilis TaxID=10195 RepID=A0A3M7RA98_BRAPC|nr:hypothetical protein BpHYR1_046245 [Brachionus plicatilis]